MTNKQMVLEKITKQNTEMQKKYLRFFASCDMELKIKILDKQKSKFFILKDSFTDVENSLLTLASLILSIKSIVSEIDSIDLNAIKFKSRNIKIRANKREKLLFYWAIIRTLKLKQNLSFRQIASYLQRYHRAEVAHSTIYKLWSELENTSKNKENKYGKK